MAALRLVPASGPPIEVSQDQVLVGREPTCDVVLTDGSVSRKHARIERRGRLWAVVDQGSANGTFVDSQRITETALRSGQEIRFGSVTFRIQIEEEAAAATMLEAPEATVVHTAPSPPPRPAAPPPPPAPPVREADPPTGSLPPGAIPAARAVVPPTGSLPPGSIPARATAPPRPPGAVRPSSRPPAPPPESMAPAPPPKKGKGPVFWIATGCCGCMLLVIALVAVIGGAAFHMTADAVAAVRGQLADLKAGNNDAAYERFTEDYKARVSREEFEVLVSRHAALRDNTDATFWKRSIENDKGTLSGVLTSTSGTHEMVSYRLAKEGGAWKIADIDFGGGSSSP
jgi:hypothetical protein